MKVFLKFNRDTAAAKICLDHWLKIFSNDDIVIISDLYNVNSETKIKRLADITVPIVNTDYSLSAEYQNCFGGGKGELWRKAGSANFTAYKLAGIDTTFWLIDADDTMFVSTNYAEIRSKLLSAEQYFDKKKLDGLSIDFYRELVNDHWSFGVCLLTTNTNLENLKVINPEEISQIIRYINLDGAFDVLRRNNTFKLESFVLNNYFFHHHVDRPQLSFGLYYWVNNTLWNKIPLAGDVISF
jgi:hypothetical protein